MVDMKQIPPDQAEYKEYFEACLNGGRPNKGLQQYLDNDRKVLSFSILWRDTTYNGGDKYFTLNYYLADSQIEVKEKLEQNSGHDPFPLMLKKSKVPKEPVMTHYPGMSLKEEQYYTEDDLIVGNKIKIFGREVTIIDCDDFTRAWYLERKGINAAQGRPKMAKGHTLYQPIPPHNGFGSEEDSMGSVKNLYQKPIATRLDEQKMFKCDMHILRYQGKLVSTEPDDENREFLLSFFCGDDTIQVYEKCDKNSGRMGGKFLKRQKFKNPATGNYYEETDFLIGKTVYLGGWKFQIQSQDEYTEKYMEDNEFPDSQIDLIIQKIKTGSTKFNSLQDYAIELMKVLDKNNDGFISFDEFNNGLRQMGVYLTDSQLHTVVRRFDTNKDGKISMEEFYNTLAQS